ncbi:MAG: hypothetical protein HYZ29_07590 [Myxococcales bacterium]|nr:hypothetical protein [Myxococcales bacterium]
MNAPKRSGPLGTGFLILFALPFAGFGLFALYQGITALLSGEWVAAIALPFGGLFFAAGVAMIRSALRNTRSPEALAAARAAKAAQGAATPAPSQMPAMAAVGAYRTAAGAARSAREAYGSTLATAPLPRLDAPAGLVLAHSIALHGVPSGFGELFFALLWNGFVWPFFFLMLAVDSPFAALFALLFCGAGVYILVSTVRKILGRRRLPRVELSAEPAYLGDELRIHVDQGGPARITRYRVGVRCEEVVKYTVGTDTRTETHVVLDQPLYDDVGAQVRFGERWTHTLSLLLPAEAPASFAAEHNQVLWTVRVHAEIAGWPDYDEAFEFRALPRLSP